MLRRLTAAALAAAIVAGCSSAAQTGSRPAPSPVTAPATSTLAVTARDYAFDAPDTISAGSTLINLKNEGPNVHHVQLWRLKDSETFEAYEKALTVKDHDLTVKPIANFAGGVGSVGPGESAQAIVELQPGRYVFVCRVFTNNSPHLYLGMVHPLTVTASTATATDWAPQPDGTVTFADKGFTMPADIKAGHHIWMFKNEGPGPRAIEVTGSGKFYGGSELIDAGSSQLVVLDLGPGEYKATSTWVAPDPTFTAFTVK